MSQRSILCVGVFALVLAKSASLEIENSNSSEDIFEFYNTSELIWTTNTTAKQRRVCKVDLKETITRDNVTFRRSFYDGRRWIIGEYIGTFRKFGTFNRTARQPNDTMDVKKTTDIVHILLLLRYCIIRVQITVVLYFGYWAHIGVP
uniref:Putative group i salivary lipocalin n=1 Tax=Rhipicephalus microplus TaxID=6941 RepID=A0A6G5A1E4_RHIMP